MNWVVMVHNEGVWTATAEYGIYWKQAEQAAFDQVAKHKTRRYVWDLDNMGSLVNVYFWDNVIGEVERIREERSIHEILSGSTKEQGTLGESGVREQPKRGSEEVGEAASTAYSDSGQPASWPQHIAGVWTSLWAGPGKARVRARTVATLGVLSAYTVSVPAILGEYNYIPAWAATLLIVYLSAQAQVLVLWAIDIAREDK